MMQGFGIRGVISANMYCSVVNKNLKNVNGAQSFSAFSIYTSEIIEKSITDCR